LKGVFSTFNGFEGTKQTLHDTSVIFEDKAQDQAKKNAAGIKPARRHQGWRITWCHTDANTLI